MSKTLLVMNSANLFVGDDDPENSQYLTIKNIKIPAIEEETMSHMGGGAGFEVDIGMGALMKFDFGFSLKGISIDVFDKFIGEGGRRRQKYTIRGNVYNLRTQADEALVAVVEAKMKKYDLNDFEKNSGVDSDYGFSEIVYYNLKLDGKEKFNADYFNGPGTIKVDGVPLFGQLATNIGA